MKNMGKMTIVKITIILMMEEMMIINYIKNKKDKKYI